MSESSPPSPLPPCPLPRDGQRHSTTSDRPAPGRLRLKFVEKKPDSDPVVQDHRRGLDAALRQLEECWLRGGRFVGGQSELSLADLIIANGAPRRARRAMLCFAHAPAAGGRAALARRRRAASSVLRPVHVIDRDALRAQSSPSWSCSRPASPAPSTPSSAATRARGSTSGTSRGPRASRSRTRTG